MRVLNKEKGKKAEKGRAEKMLDFMCRTQENQGSTKAKILPWHIIFNGCISGVPSLKI